MQQTVPMLLDNGLTNGDVAYGWLGSFWTNLFQDNQLIRRLMDGQGLLSAQLYLNYQETLNLVDRRTAPVFHRERWRRLTLKESDRNTGDAVAVQLGSTYVPVVGPQTDMPFTVGETLTIGGFTPLAGITTYPITGEDLADIATALTDSILKPTKVLLRDVDFRVEQNTLIFLNNNDPFTSGFTVQTENDTERVVELWAVNALIDKDNVYNFVGSVLGVQTPSTEFNAAYLNALWDIYNRGAPLALFRAGVAKLLDEPCIIETAEVIQYILYGDNIQVVTDQHVYVLPTTATLVAAAAVGRTMYQGDLLSDTIRVYNNIDPSRLTADGNNAVQFRQDTSALFLNSGFFRVQLRWGIGLSWQLEDIVYRGQDANGNPKLQFTMYGASEDVDAFWADFWQYCETNQLNGQTCFTGYLHATLLPTEGAVWGKVSPLEYFLYNLLKAHLMIIAVDSAKLSARGRQAMHLLSMLRDIIPAHVCFFVVERLTVPPETYDMGTTMTDVAVPALAVTCRDTAGADEYVKVRMTYTAARPATQLIPICQGG